MPSSGYICPGQPEIFKGFRLSLVVLKMTWNERLKGFIHRKMVENVSFIIKLSLALEESFTINISKRSQWIVCGFSRKNLRYRQFNQIS